MAWKDKCQIGKSKEGGKSERELIFIGYFFKMRAV